MTVVVPDHAGALRALALLRSHLAEMTMEQPDGRSFTLADTCADLLLGAQSLIKHHERWWLSEQDRG